MRKWLIAAGLATAAAVGGLLWHRGPAPWDTWRPEPVTLPSPNGYDEFVVAAQAAWAPPKQHGEATLADAALDEYVQRNRETSEHARRALRMPFLTPPPAPGSFAPNAIRLRNVLARFTEAVRWHASHDRAADAVGCRIDAAELASKQPHGGQIMDLLVAAKAMPTLCSTPAEIAELSSSEATAAARRLEAASQHHVTMVELAQAERRTLLTAYASGLRRGSLRDTIVSAEEDGANGAMVRAVLRGGKRRVWRELVRYYDDCVRAAAAPLRREPWPCSQDYGPVVDTIPSDWPQYSQRLAAMVADTNLWLTALALRAYRVDHRRYPETLDALVPRCLNAVPQDPFALAPLRYRREGDRYVVYSVWVDRVDDGGVAADLTRVKSWPESKGDRVWRPVGW